MPIEIYKDVIKPPNPIILDIGCNFGGESLKLIEAFQDYSKLISIDPLYENTEAVKIKARDRGLEDKWITVCAGIDKVCGESWLNWGMCYGELEGFPCGNIISGEHAESSTKRKIITRTIVDICPNPDIMKIDIEGHEWVIWEDIFSIGAKIIFLEIHGKGDENLPERLDYVRAKGYNIKGYTHTACSAPAEYIDINGFSNVAGNYCQVTATQAA